MQHAQTTQRIEEKKVTKDFLTKEMSVSASSEAMKFAAFHSCVTLNASPPSKSQISNSCQVLYE